MFVPHVRTLNMTYLFVCLLISLPALSHGLSYNTDYYNQTLDHINSFFPGEHRWKHRYLFNDDFWGNGEEMKGLSAT